jgi:hypothetical protein
MKLNLNRATLSAKPLNQRVNELIEAANPPATNDRHYLGASIIGGECLRRIQYDWMVDPELPVRNSDIFERGHFFEALSRRRLIAAGFKFASSKVSLKFAAADELFRGHGDGILVNGPKIPDLIYPALWEHKGVNAKSWRAIERDGLVGLYEIYAAQVAIYQAYLDCTNPALFTVVNADSCERLHFLVPFDAQLAQATSDRAVMVIEATRAGELLPRVTEDRDDWRCKLCSHRARCWGVADGHSQ